MNHTAEVLRDHYNCIYEEFKTMTDETTRTDETTQVSSEMTSLAARVTELEDTVHALTQHSFNSGHAWAHSAAVIAWLEKVGARIKSAAGKSV